MHKGWPKSRNERKDETLEEMYSCDVGKIFKEYFFTGTFRKTAHANSFDILDHIM